MTPTHPTRNSPSPTFDMQEVFDRYNAAWDANDPERIVALHAEETQFWVHDGTDPVRGKAAMLQHLHELFETYPNFTTHEHRSFFGADHWVFDLAMTADMRSTRGAPVQIRVDMVDLVTVDHSGRVLRKDTFLDGAQVQEQLARVDQ